MYMSFLIYRTEGEIEIDQTMRKLEKSPPTNELLTNDNYPRLLITGELKAAYGYTEGFFNPVEGKVFTREDFETYVTIVSAAKPGGGSMPTRCSCTPCRWTIRSKRATRIARV